MKAEYNSKLDKNIESFIQLRIEGKSFDEIATNLKTSKQSLIEWNKQQFIRKSIEEGKAFKINTLVKTYQFDLANRVSNYLKLSKRINDELATRDLTSISTESLLKMSINNDGRLRELINTNQQIGHNERAYSIAKIGDGFFGLNLDE
jgi:hypothetical protein